MAIDPTAVITSISLGLKLVDEFRNMILRWREEKVEPPGLSAEQVADTIQIIDKTGRPTGQEVTSSDLKLNEWDSTRYNALDRRAKINWNLFNELYVQEVYASLAEKPIIHVRMERIKDELCSDFREMVSIYERALGISLPDHYQLFEICAHA